LRAEKKEHRVYKQIREKERNKENEIRSKITTGFESIVQAEY
jgi:hypothetical protein